MRKILGERLNGSSVRKVGNWTVIGLDTGKKGMLSAPERKNLHAALEQAGDKPVMIVTHHTPVQQPGSAISRKSVFTPVMNASGDTFF